MPKTKFLNAADIDKGLLELAEEADEASVKIALVGGVAMQLLGSDRMTRDVDIISPQRFSLGRPVISKLTFGGISTTTPSGLPVDIIVRSDEYEELYERALLTARVHDDVPIHVVTVPYLAALKLVAGRPKDEQDLLFLLGQMSPNRYIETRALIKRELGAYAATSLDSYKAQADWDAERSK